MATDTNNPIDDLLDLYEESRLLGQRLTAEELCREHPELVGAVAEQIQALEWIPQTGTSGESASGRAIPVIEVPDFLGRYEMKEQIGEGGYGQVWRAFDPELQRSVAVKIPRYAMQLSEDSRERFLEEARKLAQLAHPGIVPVYDVGVDNGILYIVSELIEGESLAERIAREQCSPVDAAGLVADVAETLHFAHEQGFVHRDVKPGNILLDQGGRVFLADFGIATSKDDLVTANSGVSGTLPYMAPEQLDDQADGAGIATDVYGLGVVLYETLTGRVPFRAKTALELRTEQAKWEIASPRHLNREVPQSLERVCLRSIAKDPSSRFESAQDMASALKKVVTRIESKYRYRWVVLSLLVVVTLVIGVIWTSRRPGDVGQASTTGGTENDKPVPTRPAIILGGEDGVPVGWFSFDSPSDRFKNDGTLGWNFTLAAWGDPIFTVPGDEDAPPPILGDGVRMLDAQTLIRLVTAHRKPLLASEWSIFMWFRKEHSGNVDHLILPGPERRHGRHEGLRTERAGDPGEQAAGDQHRLREPPDVDEGRRCRRRRCRSRTLGSSGPEMGRRPRQLALCRCSSTARTSTRRTELS
jgi:serine/threonine protein kinase